MYKNKIIDAKMAAIEVDIGVRVKICNLNSKPELNDTLATVTGWDLKHERWKVTLD